MKFLIPILILVIVFIAGCTEQSLTDIDFYSYTQDSDCIKVKGGCCGCSAGGTATAINKNFEKEWQDKLTDECIRLQIKCLAVMSNHPSCFKDTKCVNNKCVLNNIFLNSL